MKTKEERAAYMRAWYAKNRAREQAKTKARMQDPRRRKRAKKRQRAWYLANRERILAAQKSRRAGPTAEQDRIRGRAALRKHRRCVGATGETHKGPCEACGIDAKLNFDHNHSTGRHRGWLCLRCNMILGYAKDETRVLQALIQYLMVCGT